MEQLSFAWSHWILYISSPLLNYSVTEVPGPLQLLLQLLSKRKLYTQTVIFVLNRSEALEVLLTNLGQYKSINELLK